MNPPDFDVMSNLPPGVLEQLMGLGTLDDRSAVLGGRSDILNQQLAQAQALRQPRGDHYTTGGGAALGGLGDVLRGVSSDLQTHQLRGQQQDLLGQQSAIVDQKQSGRNAYAQALVEALRKKNQGPGPQPPPLTWEDVLRMGPQGQRGSPMEEMLDRSYGGGVSDGQ